MASADLVLAPSRHAAELIEAEEPSVHVRVTPLGVDDSPAARAAAVTARDATEPTVLYAGRFADVKGTDTLIEALPTLVAEVPDVRVVLAGGLPQTRRAESRWLRRLERELSDEVRERVDFVGWLSPEQLVAQHVRAHAFVAPSRIETFGVALAEAMLCGTPIAAARIPAFEELVEHERSALLSDPEDAPALAENVARLLRDRENAATLAGEAARDARERLPWERVAETWMAAYGTVIG